MRVFLLFCVTFLLELIFSNGAWAWGPAIHTAVSCRILEDIPTILSSVSGIIRAFPLEYIYGSLSADFFVGKGQKKKEGHSHNWETARRLLSEAKGERDAAYGYGFLSHLAADVIAHNYFVPNLVHQVSKWKRMGHLYWEAKADYSFAPFYMRLARDLLSAEKLGCDELLKSAVGKGKNGLRTKRHIFTQTVKLSDFLCGSPSVSLVNRGSRYQISPEYLSSMVGLSCRLVGDILAHPESSPCLSYDPIGSRNLKLAGQNAILSRIFDIPRRSYLFRVDQELLEV